MIHAKTIWKHSSGSLNQTSPCSRLPAERIRSKDLSNRIGECLREHSLRFESSSDLRSWAIVENLAAVVAKLPDCDVEEVAPPKPLKGNDRRYRRLLMALSLEN